MPTQPFKVLVSNENMLHYRKRNPIVKVPSRTPHVPIIMNNAFNLRALYRASVQNNLADILNKIADTNMEVAQQYDRFNYTETEYQRTKKNALNDQWVAQITGVTQKIENDRRTVGNYDVQSLLGRRTVGDYDVQTVSGKTSISGDTDLSKQDTVRIFLGSNPMNAGVTQNAPPVLPQTLQTYGYDANGNPIKFNKVDKEKIIPPSYFLNIINKDQNLNKFVFVTDFDDNSQSNVIIWKQTAYSSPSLSHHIYNDNLKIAYPQHLQNEFHKLIENGEIYDRLLSLISKNINKSMDMNIRAERLNVKDFGDYMIGYMKALSLESQKLPNPDDGELTVVDDDPMQTTNPRRDPLDDVEEEAADREEASAELEAENELDQIDEEQNVTQRRRG